jgi:hypothetical protein
MIYILYGFSVIYLFLNLIFVEFDIIFFILADLKTILSGISDD